MEQRAVIHAYRHLYRQGLKLVNYSAPYRYVLLRTLRLAFRSSPARDFDPKKIANTLRFLQRASDVAGLEHKIVKNILMVRYWEQPQVKKDVKLLRGLGNDRNEFTIRKDANEHFNRTLMLLNESLGTCFR
ncbi:hypothetical protein V6Z96_002582 [Aspergillus fumigatus]